MINLGSYLAAIDSCQYIGMLDNTRFRFIGCLNLGILAGSSKGHVLTGCYVSYVNLAIVDGEVNVFCIVGSFICQLLCSAKHRNDAGICQVGCIERKHAHGGLIIKQPALCTGIFTLQGNTIQGYIALVRGRKIEFVASNYQFLGSERRVQHAKHILGCNLRIALGKNGLGSYIRSLLVVLHDEAGNLIYLVGHTGNGSLGIAAGILDSYIICKYAGSINVALGIGSHCGDGGSTSQTGSPLLGTSLIVLGNEGTVGHWLQIAGSELQILGKATGYDGVTLVVNCHGCSTGQILGFCCGGEVVCPGRSIQHILGIGSNRCQRQHH